MPISYCTRSMDEKIALANCSAGIVKYSSKQKFQGGSPYRDLYFGKLPVKSLSQQSEWSTRLRVLRQAFPPVAVQGLSSRCLGPLSGLGCAPDHGPIPRPRGCGVLVVGAGGVISAVVGAGRWTRVAAVAERGRRKDELRTAPLPSTAALRGVLSVARKRGTCGICPGRVMHKHMLACGRPRRPLPGTCRSRAARPRCRRAPS